MKILDLTLTISDKIPVFPGSPHPHFIPWEKIKDDSYNLELLFLSTHTGTHMDAPHHFLEKGAKIHEISPGLSVSAAKYLASKKVSLVGIDSPSIDVGTDSKFSVHQIFAKKGILIVENLANLDKIKSSKFHLVVLPLKLKNATGSPVRAVAFVD